MGGRAAEKLFLVKYLQELLSDLESVTKKAKAMVMIYGLMKKLVMLLFMIQLVKMVL